MEYSLFLYKYTYYIHIGYDDGYVRLYIELNIDIYDNIYNIIVQPNFQGFLWINYYWLKD